MSDDPKRARDAAQRDLKRIIDMVKTNPDADVAGYDADGLGALPSNIAPDGAFLAGIRSIEDRAEPGMDGQERHAGLFGGLRRLRRGNEASRHCQIPARPRPSQRH